ncbi:FMN-binding protein [Arthrobacter sp. M4]|uniref:FMN-binding protein n=1 Tax=Arthrobacter sp. M4 TaxID=218160 RepID=UPI001CDBBCE2|nr:FMN-binding protein [Arthrobacter sp. M4]MCA4135550.1 FMN-binding protein [Arthrobacter sp. M4]
MRFRAGVSAAIASTGILIAGWQYGLHVSDSNASITTTAAGTNGNASSNGAAAGGAGNGGAGNGGSGNSGSGNSGAGNSGSGSSGSGSTSGSASAGASAKAGGTYQGSVVTTRFGSVQVQVTVKAGTITDVTALKLTDDDRKSVQISNRAAPLLRSEVLAAQSADVQTISGATVTSEAYLTSLQAALDAANF